MQITGTHFNYFQLCHRKLWLFQQGLQMEHTSELVDEGRLIHATSYGFRPERFKEIEIGGIKIDYYDSRNHVVHEVKKSDKMETAHLWQLKYYLYVLEQSGVDQVSGILEYPKLHRNEEVWLTQVDREAIGQMLISIRQTLEAEVCPQKLKRSRCRNCSYFDFCWSGEDEQPESEVQTCTFSVDNDL